MSESNGGDQEDEEEVLEAQFQATAVDVEEVTAEVQDQETTANIETDATEKGDGVDAEKKDSNAVTASITEVEENNDEEDAGGYGRAVDTPTIDLDHVPEVVENVDLHFDAVLDRRPIVRTIEEVETGVSFPDRYDEERGWVLPELSIGSPAEVPLFQYTSNPDATSGDNPLERSDITLSYEFTIPPSDEDARKIDLHIEDAVLRFEYLDETTHESKIRKISSSDVDNEADVVHFQLQGRYVHLFYGNVSGPGGEQESVSLEITGTFEAWMPPHHGRLPPNVTPGPSSSQNKDAQTDQARILPVEEEPLGLRGLHAEEDDREMASRVIETTEKAEVRIPCESQPEQYVESRDEDNHAFGCEPPWDRVGQPGALYEEIRGLSHANGMHVFRSLAEVDTFIAIPESYVVAWDPESGLPSVGDLTVTDPMEEDSFSLRLDFRVAPNVTPLQVQRLKQELYTELIGVSDTPTLKFPSETAGISTDFRWEGPIEEENVNGVTREGTGYRFSLTFDRRYAATEAIGILQDDGGKIISNLDFIFEDEVRSRSSLKLDLASTIGGQLPTTVNEGAIEILNLWQTPIIVTGLLWFTPGKPEYKESDISPISIDADERKTIPLATQPTHEAVRVDYRIQEAPEEILSNDKIDPDRAVIEFVVSTDLDPRKYARIVAHVTLDKTGTDRTVVLEEYEGRFRTETLRFPLPAGEILSPNELHVSYDAEIYPEEGEQFEVSDVEYDAGGGLGLIVEAEDIESAVD